MELTVFQKTVIGSILNGKARTVETFLNEHCDVESVQNEGTDHFPNDGPVIKRGERVLLPRDESVAFSQLMEFIALWKKLESVGLLFTISTGRRRFQPVFKRMVGPGKMEIDEKIMSILRDHRDKEIAVSQELASFTHRGYLTAEEEHLRSEEQDRKVAQRDTRRIAYWSIGVSVFIAFCTSLSGYLTYTKERSVTITNTNAFPNPERVLLLNPQTVTITNVVNLIVEASQTNSSSAVSVRENR